ncbi:MAG: M23 family metallopeptidase [bacterium]
MDTTEQILLRMKNKKKNYSYKEPSNNKSSNVITSFLISIIFLFSCLIYIKIDEDNKVFFKETFFVSSLSFTSINNFYEKNFGSIAPSIKTEEFVFSGTINYTKIEEFENYETLYLSGSNIITTLCGGVVVFIGEKEETGYTVIVQGNDGYDIWYGNVENVSLSIYDYVDTGEIIGEVSNMKLNMYIYSGKERILYEDYSN